MTRRNIRLTLCYDGSNYYGWQVQSNGPTIQSHLETAIEKIAGERIPVFSAGRTDSGVHAIGQVANFHTAHPMPAEHWRPALQTKLPYDIVIRSACEAPQHFHATYSAIRKRYRYLLYNGTDPLPFARKYVYAIRQRLNVPAMHAAAQVLLGTHDFRCFETDWPNKVTSVRTVEEVFVRRTSGWSMWDALAERVPHSANGQESTEGDFIALDIVADGFLYNMVRCIMGTLINVGRGVWSTSEIERIVQSQSRMEAGATAPACGLYLVQVDYAPDGARQPKKTGMSSEAD